MYVEKGVEIAKGTWNPKSP